MNIKYSILMSVYAKENAEHFRKSVESMLNQTVGTDDFVLICDGPLTDELYRVIDDVKSSYPQIFRPIYLEKNVGTGAAANVGLKNCRHEIVVKMDSDDISYPERCEKQLMLFEKKPELIMCGAFIKEFRSETEDVIAIKKTPVSHEEILKFAKRRNPFNNQTLVLKKSFALAIGGYAEMTRCEDYEFVVRMLMAGAVCENLPEVLVDYRVTSDNYKRRKNRANTKAFISVRWKSFKCGFSGFFDFLIPCIMQIGIFLLPSTLTEKIYKKFLR